MVLRPETPIDEPLLCWENIILLEAEYDANVWEMAMRRAMDVDASDEYTLRSDYPVPSRWEFAGTRKIVEVRQDSDGASPANGDELTFNTLYLDKDEIDKFVSGGECDAIIGNEADDPPARNLTRRSE
jgi:hypothetical protein